MADKIKCKGCGSMVWVGAKIYDGYCHDCYVRGRHLPEDTEPWDIGGTPSKKKPKPKPTPFTPPTPTPPMSSPTTRRRRIPRLRRVWLLLFIPLATALIFNGAFWIQSLIVNLGGEAAAMNVIREASQRALYRGDNMDYEAVTRGKRALDEFIGSGASYRMSGVFAYAYRDGARGTLANNFSTAVSAEVEMSYNSETDVYKFVITGSGEDEKLASHRIEDGTYYIVNENDKTYVLYDFYGERTTTDISEDPTVYNFLMKYRMENAIYTNYLDREAHGYSIWNGYYLYRFITIDNPGLLPFPDPRIELRTYQNKPVSYIYCYHDKETDIGCEITLQYYYDNIPQDVPSVADYQ